MEEPPIIFFDDSVKSKIVKALGYTQNDNSELVSKDGKLVTSQGFDKISFDEFGGVLRSSKIPIKKEDSELITYFSSE